MSVEVDYDDLEYTDKDTYVLNNGLFSGVAVERDDDGTICSEMHFLNAKLQGESFSFFRNGSKQSETFYQNGLKHGLRRRWFEDGRIKEQTEFEYDVPMSSIEWSDDGRVIKEYNRPVDDHLYRLVIEKRKRGLQA